VSWSYWTPLEAPLAVNVEELYTRYGPMVYRRCKALLKDDQAAEELMQETFIQILRRQDVLEVHAPSSMLYRTATNLCLNRIRAKGRRPEDPDDELVMRIASAPDSGGVSEARSVLARIFSTQKESTRTMATLLLLDGMTLDEVAEEVGMSVSGVRKRMRGLKAHVAELEGVL
jgi:RNA polymerase sigma-70 factor (ECF subfamily)